MVNKETAEKLIDAVKQDNTLTVYELLSENEAILQDDTTITEFVEHVVSVEMVKLLLEFTQLERIKFVSSLYGMSLINYTIMHGKSIDTVEELVKMGDDINELDKNNRTPLIESLVCYKDVNFIEKLIILGADVTKYDNYCRSPLHFAHNKDTVSLLLKYSASINHKDENGQTPLSRGLELNREKEVITELIEGGASLKGVDQNGNSVLHLTNDTELFNYFVKHKAASVNCKNKKGQTPLMKAVKEHKNVNLIRTILENGANPNSLDVNCDTPLHYAYNRDVVNLLVSYGANINAKNKYNQVPFHTIFHHRPITFSYGFSSAEVILKHTLLHNDSEIPSDTGSSDTTIKTNFHMLIEACRKELSKMKEYELIENLTFYDYCTFKKSKYIKFIKTSGCKYRYNELKIKELFPMFYEIILMKIEHNELKVRKHLLRNKLNQICFRSKSFDLSENNEENHVNDNENELKNGENSSVDEPVGRTRNDSSEEESDDVELDYDTLCHVSKYLDYDQLSNLFLASM